MSELTDMSRTFGSVLRRWPLVVALTLAGALVAAVLGSAGPRITGYSSRATVRVATINALPNFPTVSVVSAYASSAEAKRSAAASEGLDPAGISVAASADAKDPQVVNVVVTAPDASLAEEWATAIAEQARSYGLSRIGWMIELEQVKAERLQRRMDSLTEEAQEMRRLSTASASPSMRVEYLRSAQALEQLAMSAEDSLDESRYTRRGYLSYVSSAPASSATKLSGQGIVLSNVLRGALVGLFLGALIAALLDRRRHSV